MPDAWTLDTPGGPYTLNPTFSAPKYQPGSVSGPGVLRRDDRNTYQRSGDGLATPGPLTLIGRVWRDDQDQALMLQELEAIRAAVATCTTVTRSNNAGEYVYDSLAGGATPEITPDGLGGWRVTLDLWPGRAEPLFLPRPPDANVFRDDFTSYEDGAALTTGPYGLSLLSSFHAEYNPGLYGVPKNVARLGKGNFEGRAHARYEGQPYSSGRARAAARVWTGLAHQHNRHLGVSAYYTFENPHGNTGLFAVLYGNGNSFRILRGTGAATVETLATVSVAWSLDTWYEIELVWDSGVATASLRDATGVLMQTLTTSFTPPPVSGFYSGLVLYALNNTSQQIAFDWAEFETAP